jgi:ubiquitin-protein ligase
MCVPRAQGLISFNQDIVTRAQPNPLTPRFEDGIKDISPAGRTRIWDCLLTARQTLLTAKTKYPNATLRIIVISDGEDMDSVAKPDFVAAQLIGSEIVADAIIVSARDTCKPLSALCHLTGGCAFRPASIEDGLQLFEQEGLLSLSQRPPIVRFAGQITRHVFEQHAVSAQFDMAVVNIECDEGRQVRRLVTAGRAVYQLQEVRPTQTRLARLRTELKFAAVVQDQNARVVDSQGTRLSLYDAELRIYPVADHLDRWRVFLKGRLGTPYASKWWYLTVTFPPDYPERPPVVRFISVPYHINISSEGQICLPFLSTGYRPNARVVELIQEMRGPLLMPDKDSPVQLVAFDLFKKNRSAYNRKAMQSCSDAKNSPEEWLAGLEVSDNPPGSFSLGEPFYAPRFERSLFTGEPIPRADQVISSTGVIYHRDELRRYISITANPICPVTGWKLTETAAELSRL